MTPPFVPMSLGGGGNNPVLDELDNLSPHAKGTLAMAHSGILSRIMANGMGSGPQPAPDAGGSASASNAGVAPMIAPKPVLPTLGAPMQPPPSATPAATPNPTADAHKAELGRLTTGDTGHSGIAQIHNPWARIPLQIADAVGGGLFPGIERMLPGTEGHHAMLVNHAQNAVDSDQQQAEAEGLQKQNDADVQQQKAETEALKNPDEPLKPSDKTVQTDQGIMQFDSKTGKYDIPVGQPPDKNSADKFTFQQTDHGLLRINAATGEAAPVTLNGEPVAGKPGAEKTPSHDDKYISIMAKPATQRTPEENAFTKSYEHWINVSKTQPGIGRMEVLMNGRPVTAVDPNNPDSLIYERAGDAMRSGAQAPGSISQSVRRGVENDFTHGKDATVLTNINTAHEHTAQLLKVAQALGNGDSKLVNQLSNAWADQTGQPAPANLQMVKTALAGEIGKVFTGGVATVEEGKEITKAINSANSPAQFLGVAQNVRQLMESKRGQLKDQYDAGMKGQGNFGNSDKGKQSQPSSDMVSVQIPGSPAGQIHRSQLDAFKKRYPNATEVK